MDNPIIKQQEAHDDDNAAYGDWVVENADDLIYEYGDTITEFPESIYEGVLDDDYPDAEERYLESLELKDVPDEFLQSQYENYLETGGVDPDAAYEAERERDEVGF